MGIVHYVIKKILMQKKRRKNINKKELYIAIMKSQAEDRLTPEALCLITQLCDNYISQFYYKDPMDRDDCYQTAIVDCIKAWKKFDSTKSNNAFSFFTQTIKIGIIKGWRELYPGKLSTISLSGAQNNDGIYSI